MVSQKLTEKVIWKENLTVCLADIRKAQWLQMRITWLVILSLWAVTPLKAAYPIFCMSAIYIMIYKSSKNKVISNNEIILSLAVMIA